jgi:flagellar biosynthesis GTPase FlhF
MRCFPTMIAPYTLRAPTLATFGIKQSDRFFHMYVIGETGVGKTTSLSEPTAIVHKSTAHFL